MAEQHVLPADWMHEPHLNPCERDKAIQTPLPPSRLKDGEKQYGDLPTCSPGEVKGGGAGGGRRGRRAAAGQAGSSGPGRQLRCESGRESLAGDQEKLARFERELYEDLCWGLVGWVQEAGTSPTA